MKYLSIIGLFILGSSFLLGQSMDEQRRVSEEDNGFELYLVYQVSDAEESQVIQEVTSIFGQGVSDTDWVSPKQFDNNYIIKLRNGFIFVRASDHSQEQLLTPKLKKLDEALMRFSDLE